MNNKYYLKFKETIRTSTSTNDHTSVTTRMAKTSLVYLHQEKAWNNRHGAFSKVAVKAEVTAQSTSTQELDHVTKGNNGQPSRLFSLGTKIHNSLLEAKFQGFHKNLSRDR